MRISVTWFEEDTNRLPNPICWRVEWRDSGCQISNWLVLSPFLYLLNVQMESLTTPNVSLGLIKEKSWSSPSSKFRYPLVNIYMAMEYHHFPKVNQRTTVNGHFQVHKLLVKTRGKPKRKWRPKKNIYSWFTYKNCYRWFVDCWLTVIVDLFVDK
jgi:hypothetical protein